MLKIERVLGENRGSVQNVKVFRPCFHSFDLLSSFNRIARTWQLKEVERSGLQVGFIEILLLSP